MSRWSFLGRLCFIIYNHMLTSLFQEMWARRQGLWFLIISENNLPGPQQQRSKVPFDLTPRTKIRLQKCQTSFFFPLSFHDGLVRYCGQEQTLQWTRHWEMWRMAANVGGCCGSDKTTNALYVSFSKCQSAYCWIWGRKWSIWETIKGSTD